MYRWVPVNPKKENQVILSNEPNFELGRQINTSEIYGSAISFGLSGIAIRLSVFGLTGTHLYPLLCASVNWHSQCGHPH